MKTDKEKSNEPKSKKRLLRVIAGSVLIWKILLFLIGVALLGFLIWVGIEIIQYLNLW